MIILTTSDAFEDYIETIAFFQFCFSLLASSFVFISLNTLLYRLPKNFENFVSCPIRINIIAWIFTSGFNIVYVSISIVSRILPKIETSIVFWSGALYFAATTSVSVSVFFLMLDRCFILLMPTQIDLTAKSNLTVVNAVLVVLQFFVFIAVIIFFELPTMENTDCEVFSCVTKKHAYTVNVARCIFGIVNSLMATTFFFLLLRYNKRRSLSFQVDSSTNSERRKSMSTQPANSIKARGNIFAAIAVLSQIIFNFLPNLTAFIFLQVFHMILSFWVGPAVSTLTQLDALCSTIVYLKIIGGRLSKTKQDEMRSNQT